MKKVSARAKRKNSPQNFKIRRLIQSVSEQMGTALRQKLVPHPGELGTGREEVIREFFRKHLPKRFGVSTGFVFDVHGTISNQIDIVIFDNLSSPVFEVVGDKKFFPCESVVCVGEVKSVLTSKRDVKKAFENILSVKSLDRSAAGENFSIGTGEPIAPPENHLHQIFAFLFVVDKAVSEQVMRKTLFEYLWQHDRHLWPNLCFYFDHYLLTYQCENGVCPNPMDALAITSVPYISKGYLLLAFYRLLAGAINVTNVASFSYWHYLEGPEGYQDTYSYAFKDAPVKGPLPDHLLKRPIR